MTDVRLVTANDEQKLKKFYKNAYGENHILNNSSHSDWQFLKNPFNILIYKFYLLHHIYTYRSKIRYNIFRYHLYLNFGGFKFIYNFNKGAGKIEA